MDLEIWQMYRLPESLPAAQRAVNRYLANMGYKNEEFEKAFRNARAGLINFLVKENLDLSCLKIVIYQKLNMITSQSKPLMKSDQKSDLIRINGNKLLHTASILRASSYLPILYQYELALCFAESPDCKAKSYGNISKMYQNMKMMEHSLKACEYALKYSIGNEKFREKILGRILEIKADGLRLSPKENSVSLKPKTHISNLIGLENNDVIAKKLLKPGDIVAVTKSFTAVGAFVFHRQFCGNCGSRISTIKIPCKHCPYALFCSKECEDLGINGFHGFECQLLINDNVAFNDYIFQLTFKFVCKAFELTDGQALAIFTTDNCFEWEDNSGDDDMSILKAIFTMKKVKMNLSQMVEVTFKLDLFFDQLFGTKFRKNPKFCKFFTDERYSEFKQMFIHIYPILAQNSFNNDYTYTVDAFYGHLTHSCRPNLLIFRDPEYGTNHYVVFEEIKSGEKLNVALAETYSHFLPNPQRQIFFKNQFGFDCRCYACQKGIPTENVEKQALQKLYDEMEQRQIGVDFKELIGEFIKPNHNYPTKKALFSLLYYFSLNQQCLDLTFESVYDKFGKIEQGLM